MARLDYIDTYENSFFSRLYASPPSGYSANQIVNADLLPVKTMDPPFLRQSTVITVRDNSSAGGLTSRTRGIHTVSVFINKDLGAAKREVSSTVKEIVDLFENKYFEGIYCLEATPELVGDEPSTNLYRYDININFYFEGN